MEFNIFFFVFIVIIFIIIIPLEPAFKLGIILIIISWFLVFRSENFTDNWEWSRYGNIDKKVIDMSTELKPDPKKFGNPELGLDCSDVIDASISRGTDLNPNFTPLKNNDTPKYDYLSGKQNTDELFARKQQQRSDINKRAIDGAVRSTKDIYNKSFDKELDENEHRVWYSSEAQDLETDWNPY